MNVAKHLKDTASKNSEKIFITTKNKSWTYAQVYEAILKKSSELKNKTQLVLRGKPSFDYIISFLACFHSGITVIPVNTYWREDQIEEELRRVEGFSGSELLLFTSGSSGKSKIVCLSYENLYFNALGSNENLKFGFGDIWLLSLPLFHVSGIGILMRTLLAGASIYLPSEEESVKSILKTKKISHVSFVPTQLKQWLDLEELNNLKAILLGGGPISEHLLNEANERGLKVYSTYGLSEMASQVVTGKVLPYRELQITEGEICVRGECLFHGYLEGEKINPSRDEKGWFHTGDLGQFDDRGELQILGRKDNLLISGGENIYPEEIEKSLLSIPYVVDAIVVAVDDEEFGSRPVAFVQLEDSELLQDELKTKLAEMLPKYKVPDSFFSWPETTRGLKPNRAELTNLACEKLNQYH